MAEQEQDTAPKDDAEREGRRGPDVAGAGPEGPAEGSPDAGALAEAVAAPGDRAEEYLQTMQRIKADFDNYRRRTAADQARWGQAAVGAFVLQLLPVVDNLERAVSAVGDAQAVRQGVDLTVRQLRDVLQAAGVRPIDAEGQPFDPGRHEAVAGTPEGVVVEEYRRGYLYNDQVLRPAMVRVGQPGGSPAEGPAPVAPEADERKGQVQA